MLGQAVGVDRALALLIVAPGVVANSNLTMLLDCSGKGGDVAADHAPAIVVISPLIFILILITVERGILQIVPCILDAFQQASGQEALQFLQCRVNSRAARIHPLSELQCGDYCHDLVIAQHHGGQLLARLQGVHDLTTGQRLPLHGKANAIQHSGILAGYAGFNAHALGNLALAEAAKALQQQEQGKW